MKNKRSPPENKKILARREIESLKLIRKECRKSGNWAMDLIFSSEIAILENNFNKEFK